MTDTLESLELEVKHSASGAADDINKVTIAVRSLGQALGSTLPQLKSFQSAMAGISNPISITENRTQNFVDTINNVRQAATPAKNATQGVSRSINEMSGAASKSSKPLGGFIASLKRIAFYRFLRTIIKNISQAFQEGLTWAYQFSAGVDGEGNRFASAMDRIKTAGSAMKAQLGSAFIGLLTTLQPVITTIINLITKLADAMSQIFAAFTGTTYLKAAEVPQQWADAAGSAGRAAKEWKNQLLGFDEINRLEEPSQGGGGGSTGVDPSTMFTDSPIEGWAMKIRDWIEEIKEKIRNSGIVEAFGKIKDAIMGIGDSALWQVLTEVIGIIVDGAFIWALETVRDILLVLADILNGDLASGVKDFKDLIVDFLYDPLILVAEVVDTLLGTNIAEWLKDLKEQLKAWDPTESDAFQKLKEAFDGLSEAWGKLKESFNDLLTALGVLDEKTGAAEALKNIFVEITKIGFGAVLEFIAVWLTLCADVITVLADILHGDFYSALNDTKNLLSDLVFGVLLFFADIIDRIFGTNLAEWIEGVANSVKEFDLTGWFGDAGAAIGKFFTEDIPQFWEDLKYSFEHPSVSIKAAWEAVLKPIKEFDWKQFGYDVGQSVGNAVTSICDAFKTFFTETLPEVWEKVKLAFKTFFTETLPKFFKEKIPELWNTIKESFKTFFTETLPESLSDVGEWFKEVGEAIWNGMADGFKTATSAIRDLVDGIVSGFKDALGIHSPSTVFRDEIGQYLGSGLIEGITDAFDTFFNVTLPGMFDTFSRWWESLTVAPFHIPTPQFDWTYTEADGLLAKALEFVGLPATIPHLNISWYEQGGFPTRGDLFFANENGAEMVGSMGGRTAVANNDQIVEGIRQGVFEAVSAAMSGGGQDVNVKVFLDSREIKAGQQRLSRAMGV